MSIYLSAIGLLLKVTLVFIFLYAFIPSKIMKKEYTSHQYDLFDKLFVSLVHSNLVVIGLVHLLVLMDIYEPISLIISLLVITVVYKAYSAGIKGSDWVTSGRKLVSKVFDWIESDRGFIGTILDKISAKFKSKGQSLTNSLRTFFKNPLPWIVMGTVFFIGLTIRFNHSVRYAYYGASDPYVHLAWTKYIGMNDLYVDGVYPLGYNALISALNKLFFIDPYVIIRFIGAIGSGLILLSILYGAKKIKKDLFIPAIVGLAFYVLFLNGSSSEWRQLSALPQEYAAAFLIPGMVFLNKYFNEKKRSYFILAVETFCLILLIHLYSALVLALAYIVICLFHIKDFFKIRFLSEFATYMFGAAFLGLLPLTFGLLSGIGLHEPSFQFVKDSASVVGQEQVEFHLLTYKEENPAFLWLIVSSVVLFVLSFVYAVRKKNWIGPVSAILTIFFYLQYRSEETGFPQIMDKSRTEVFLGIFAALTISLLAVLLMSIKFKWLKTVLTAMFVTATLVIILNAAPGTMPKGDRYEYNEVAQAYMDIKKDYPVLNWTIVSPVEQYSESLGYGWHYQLWQYVMDVTEDNKTDLEIPTEYVFWFVEKVPLNSGQPVSMEDAQLDFPVITGNLDEYYTKTQNRRIIQAKAFYYMEEQLETNPNLRIYADTENVRIYMLQQEQYKSYSGS
ncbi:MAG TPA: hypothetical protein DDZ89_11300 [Clostridiales bacterium]|nr:hypothetical protein [Clostridiales bacterium]